MERAKKKRKKILFVCTGNTCRSPMAEALLKKKIKERKIKFVSVASAGLDVTETTMNPFSEEVLSEHDISMPRFRPRQLTKKMRENAFVIITMTQEQKRYFGDEEKVYSMREVAGTEIPDPYGKGVEAYRETYEKLLAVTERIVSSVWG